MNIAIATPQSWQNCDKIIYTYIDGFVNLLRDKLTSHLVGVYLHGSLAMGSYFPPKSDLDFIIVTRKRLGNDLAHSLNRSISQYAKNRPTVGSIECSVITLPTAQDVPEHVPYELHYSEFCLNDAATYGTEKFDPDLPAHLMSVRKRGVCLLGMPIDRVFGEISWDHFFLSVMGDFNWIVEREHICESPYYGVLNICRVLQMIKEGNRKYLSKYEAALWGIEVLPSEHIPLIRKALQVYASDEPIDEGKRKTGGVTWDKSVLWAFRDYARKHCQRSS